jgi:hypothetical protein
MAVAPGPFAAHLALQQHHQLGVEAQHAVKALTAIGVGDLIGDLRRLEVRRQEHAHQATPPHPAARRAFLRRIDEMRGLQVDRAVRQMALGKLSDLVQQRLAGERHEPQHDHRRARQLILVAAPEIPVGLEHVQVRIRGDALHSAPGHELTPPIDPLSTNRTKYQSMIAA